LYQKNVLPNGVRVITEKIDYVRSVAMGLWIGAGSRNETKGYEGISHFIEHMFFKGTEKRTARQLAETLEAVGGQLNAFTTKELTCYFAKVLDEDVNLAIDVLNDMFFNSRFDPVEIDKEKNVVLEEIKMYQDSPDELIHDFFSQHVWNNHPLGKPILGAANSINGLNREKVRYYLDNFYTPDQIVLAVAGKIEPEEILKRVSVFGDFRRQRKKNNEDLPNADTVRKSIKKDTEQMHLILGVPGIGQDDDDIFVLHIINSILGGGLSSRLFQEIREQRGLAYSVYSYHSTYKDSGLFAVYAGTSPNKTEEVIKCTINEMNKLKTEGLLEEDLEKTKAQIKGNLYLGLESVSSRMSRLGKTELSFGRVKTAEEAVEQLEKVTVEDVKRLMERLWIKEKISVLTLGQDGYGLDFDGLINSSV